MSCEMKNKSITNLYAQTLSLWRFHTFCSSAAPPLNARSTKHEIWRFPLPGFFIVPALSSHVTTSRQGRFEMTSNLVRSEWKSCHRRHMQDWNCFNKIDSRLTEESKSSPLRETWENWNRSNHVCGFLVSTPLISDPSLSPPLPSLIITPSCDLEKP